MSTSGSSSPNQRPADRASRKDFALGNMADDLLELTLTMCGKDEHKTQKRWVRKLAEMLGHGEITAEYAGESYHGWREHASHGDCGNMIRAMDKRYAEALRKVGYRLIITKKRVIVCREPLQNSHQDKSCTSTRP